MSAWPAVSSALPDVPTGAEGRPPRFLPGAASGCGATDADGAEGAGAELPPPPPPNRSAMNPIATVQAESCELCPLDLARRGDWCRWSDSRRTALSCACERSPRPSPRRPREMAPKEAMGAEASREFSPRLSMYPLLPLLLPPSLQKAQGLLLLPQVKLLLRQSQVSWLVRIPSPHPR